MQDITALDGLLVSQDYLCGIHPTRADALVYSCLLDKLPDSPSNIAKWAQSMASLSLEDQQKLPQHKQVIISSEALWLLSH